MHATYDGPRNQISAARAALRSSAANAMPCPTPPRLAPHQPPRMQTRRARSTSSAWTQQTRGTCAAGATSWRQNGRGTQRRAPASSSGTMAAAATATTSNPRTTACPSARASHVSAGGSSWTRCPRPGLRAGGWPRGRRGRWQQLAAGSHRMAAGSHRMAVGCATASSRGRRGRAGQLRAHAAAAGRVG